tara:strand:+ start:660 stop:818 length:159 start_codon:yes stop_codon:yes gene_type:complete
MRIYTVAQWKEDFDELLSEVENGETIGIINDQGEMAVMMPYKEKLIKKERKN